MQSILVIRLVFTFKILNSQSTCSSHCIALWNINTPKEEAFCWIYWQSISSFWEIHSNSYLIISSFSYIITVPQHYSRSFNLSRFLNAQLSLFHLFIVRNLSWKKIECIFSSGHIYRIQIDEKPKEQRHMTPSKGSNFTRRRSLLPLPSF